MSEPAIRLENVSRVFRIYGRPQDRLWSVFHLEFIRRPRYRELWALRDIDLSVAAGERLGIVGRNGAGKSTMLKMVCGNIAPTEGRISVRGRIQALMELGTGFHPDFTGRQNIRAFLGYQGVVGAEAQRLEEEAADFSELEEFLDYPVKGYSAGMYARLAFSAATCIQPEVLIIDEVLGAGDAYFAGKCLEKMRALTSHGATVLFVSHDITSVQLLCDRAIWIDHGRMVADGECLEVSRRYLAEIRREEEDRLRAASQKLRKRSIGTVHRAEELYDPMLFHLVADASHPQQEHPILRLALKQGETRLREIAVGDARDNDVTRDAFLYDDAGFMDWSAPRRIGKRYARAYCDRGGRYGHAPWEFHLPVGTETTSLQLEVEYVDSASEPVHVELYQDKQYLRLGTLAGQGSGGIRTVLLALPREQAQATPEEAEEAGAPAEERVSLMRVGTEEGYGSGEGRIVGFALLDADGVPGHLFETRSRMVARLEYRFTKPVPAPTFVVCIYRADGTCSTQAFCSAKEQWREDQCMAGWVEAVFDPLLLGRGHYAVSAAIFCHVDMADPEEPPAYHLLDRFYRFQVVQPAGINVELGSVLTPVSWVQSHRAAASEPTTAHGRTP
jgi:lipopolysaccharide transport system ATP-binding protein